MIASDMMTDKSGRTQMNIICINDSGVVFAEAVDCKAEMKSGAFIAGILRLIIERVRPEHVVALCMDGGSNYKSACKLLQKDFRHIEVYIEAWVMDGAWWKKAEFFVQLMELPYPVMGRTDSSAKGMMGVIYDIMLQLTEELDALLDGKDSRLSRADKEGV
ncbi:unnamed protein product [Closterium sp. Naga37s-1]|nr:unnamed protein product [Closterium sp. Naga37s-1]